MTERLSRGAGRAAILVAIWVLIAIAPTASRAAPYADMIMDARSGEVLHATNADSRLHPASLTKMMTLYVTFEAIRLGEISLDTMVTISSKAAAEPPSKLGLRAGQRIQLRYLIRAAAVKSANDAATAIGEAVGGSEAAFARRMNRTARALGMTRSTFKNAHGLTEEGHLSTARDMTILGRHLFYDYPQYYNIFSRRETDAGVTAVANTNRRFLDAYPGADGIKTGYTRAAGFNLVASAERGGKRIIATVFGGTSTAQRNARMVELMNIGFNRAPARVAVNRPDLPRYDGLPEEPAPDMLAAETGGDPNVRIAGKILRVSGAVARSPRPVPRGSGGGTPVPAEQLLADIESDVAAAVAGLGVAASAAAGASPAPAPAAPAEVASAAVAAAEATAEAVAEAAAAATAEQVAAAAAQAVAEAIGAATADAVAALSEDTGAAGETAPVALAAAAPMTAPRPRPSTAEAPQTASSAQPPVQVGLAAAEAAAPEEPAGEAAVELAVAVDAEADEAGLAGMDLAQADSGEGMAPLEAGAASAALSLLAAEGVAASSAEGPDEMILASAATIGPPRPEPVIRPEPESPEVVTRLSTSGGRHFGISVGRFPSRHEAEKALITVSLSDSSVLAGALARVVQRSTGFEANFMGMSAEQAGLACRRFEARGRACTTIGN